MKLFRWTYFLHLLLILFILQAGWRLASPSLLHEVFYLNASHVISSKSNKADLVVFSYNRPLQLYAFLETVKKNVKGIGELHILYRTSAEKFEEGYDIVKEKFPDVKFHLQSQKGDDFQKLLLEITEHSPSDFVSYAVDDIIITQPFNLAECVAAMKEYHAYVFIIRAGMNLDYDHPKGGKNLCKFEETKEGMILWTLHNGTRIWDYPHFVDFSLHNKGEILQDLKKIHFSAPNSMEQNWTGLLYVDLYHYLPTRKVRLLKLTPYSLKRALSFKQSRLINIPLNLVNHEIINPCMKNYSAETLNALFLAGYKMDTSLFQGYQNTKVHENLIPQFKEN